MKLRSYFIRLIWGCIPALLVSQDWVRDRGCQKITVMLLFSIISGLLYPFSDLVMKKIGLKFAKKEFWEKDFFTSATGGSLQAILFVFCFLFAIPLSTGYALFTAIKHLTRKGQV
ncbi:colicin E1 family microcin immunity protein [Erwinia sp. E602]|uniref:colicin E1 family microcin immunity protein n=1 Tax=Erwinia sp. E602 TaxID=2675378 RepID=UPI001BAC1851|nr:colicin E1 family microcin immunity protein [Erwinia sp. E602]